MHIKLNLKHKLLISGNVSLVLFSILFILVLENINLVRETFSWVDHTQEVLNKTQKIEKLIVDMETGQRGFLITGKEEFLEPFHLGKNNLSEVIKETKELISDNSAQVQRILEISKLINLWLKKAGAHEIELRRKVNKGELRQSIIVSAIETKTGKNIIDTLRNKLKIFKDTETELMSLRQKKARDSFYFLKYLIIFGTILSIIVSFYIFSKIAQKVISPILQLIDFNKKTSSKFLVSNFGIEEKINGEGEIGELINSYYEMLIRLRDEIVKRKLIEDDLQNSHKNLETQIEKRTKDLILEKKKAEISNQAKSDFLTQMSHELRTPMTIIMGFTELLQIDSKNPLNDHQRELLEQVSSTSHHLLEIINEMLDLSSIESGSLEIHLKPIDLVPILNEIVTLSKPLADKDHISLELPEYSKNQYYINVDPLRFKQVVLNLVSNAIKYNKPNGSVIISFEKIKDETLRLSVKDTGTGIPKNKEEMVFQPFERINLGKDIEGTGIGLTISKKLIELMGGTIGFNNLPDGGCLFYVDVFYSESKNENIFSKNSQNQLSSSL
jgi:two-component system sensor histidine kinase/response regulator